MWKFHIMKIRMFPLRAIQQSFERKIFLNSGIFMIELGIEIGTFKSYKHLSFLLLLIYRLFWKCGDLIIIFSGLNTVHNGAFEWNGQEYTFKCLGMLCVGQRKVTVVLCTGAFLYVRYSCGKKNLLRWVGEGTCPRNWLPELKALCTGPYKA